MTTHHPTEIQPFSANPDFDFEIRTALGGAAAGVTEPGEVLAATERVRAHDHEGWYDAWSALAERTAETAEACAAKGHRVSAAEAYLRASAYYSVAVNALSGLDDLSRLAPAFGLQQRAWEGFVAHTAARVAPLQIPYEGGSLPGWFFRAAGETAPTLVAVNGSDGALAGLWSASNRR